jgi:hypothetical protein
MATAAEVAAWMHAEFEREGELAQAAALAALRARFGAEFVAGGRIRKDVLLEFRRLDPAGRVWVGSYHVWRRKAAGPPGREGGEGEG